MGDLSANFSRIEFACKCGRATCKGVEIQRSIVDALQQLRDALGLRVSIVSGVRCKAHNKAIGGAPNSQHVLGIAADIHVERITPEKLYAIVDAIPAFRNGGVGYGFGRFHVDTRAGRARWRYNAMGNTIPW
jgi:zinc D-Ala-D-Ala carboxypeptidase